MSNGRECVLPSRDSDMILNCGGKDLSEPPHPPMIREGMFKIRSSEYSIMRWISQGRQMAKAATMAMIFGTKETV